MDKPHISFAGAGRVAASLCKELYRSGYTVDMVVSRTEKNGESLAGSVSAIWSQNLIFPETTGLIIVAVPDNTLENVLNGIECDRNVVVAHTAGSYGTDVFPEKIRKKGVFYPLQTFSAGRSINFTEVPFLLESADEETRKILFEVASTLSDKIFFTDTEHRRMIHLAAVFACNFTNHMLTAGNEIVRNAGFQMNILEPLVRETLSKALEQGPERSQTGPAFRNDTITIEKQLSLLSSNPEFKQLYTSVTQSIIEYYKNRTSD